MPVEISLISYVYNISVTPQMAIIYKGSAKAQLAIPYNSLYNVSISAAVPCGLNTTTYIEFNYSKWLILILSV